MSDKRATLRERTQRFRRRMRGEKKGVSPVVATLILILIAVAAAAALYLWLVAWQGNITGGIGNQQVQATFTIGGSTSVYPFSSLAVSWYEQNHSDVAIQDDQGGTGAGMLSVCEGHVDVGAASTPETVSGLQSSDNCPTSPGITITTIAYDAVDVVVQGANTHGLLSINYDTLDAIYQQGSTSAPYIAVTAASTIDGSPIAVTIPTQGTEFSWDQIPAAVQGATIGSLGAPYSPEALVTGIGAGAPCAAPYAADQCVAGGDSPCGWSVCAGGAQAIVPVERSDASGTTQTFEAKLLGYTADNKISSTFAGLGYSGCGSNNLLSDCGILLPSAQQEQGNPGVLTYVAGNPAAIGYASDGLARTTTGVGTAGIIPFDGVGQVGTLVQTSGSNIAYGAVVPTTGATGTIAGGITSSTTINNYAGWRPFEFVTLQPPAGEVQDFITFITAPDVNQNLATVTGEVSLYSV